MIVDGAHSVVGDLLQTEFTPANTDFARFLRPYECAISALTSKVSILEGEFTHADHYCPIRAVTSRVKSPDSIRGKAARIGLAPTSSISPGSASPAASFRISTGSPPWSASRPISP